MLTGQHHAASSSGANIEEAGRALTAHFAQLYGTKEAFDATKMRLVKRARKTIVDTIKDGSKKGIFDLAVFTEGKHLTALHTNAQAFRTVLTDELSKLRMRKDDAESLEQAQLTGGCTSLAVPWETYKMCVTALGIVYRQSRAAGRFQVPTCN